MKLKLGLAKALKKEVDYISALALGLTRSLQTRKKNWARMDDDDMILMIYQGNLKNNFHPFYLKGLNFESMILQ